MIMEEIKKGDELILKYGLEISHKIIDEIITELQIDWNQDRIDFYLDVKNYLDSKQSIAS